MTKGSTGFVQFFQAAGIRISQLSASMQRTIGESALESFEAALDPSAVEDATNRFEEELKDLQGSWRMSFKGRSMFQNALGREELEQEVDAIREILTTLQTMPEDQRLPIADPAHLDSWKEKIEQLEGGNKKLSGTTKLVGEQIRNLTAYMDLSLIHI